MELLSRSDHDLLDSGAGREAQHSSVGDHLGLGEALQAGLDDVRDLLSADAVLVVLKGRDGQLRHAASLGQRLQVGLRRELVTIAGERLRGTKFEWGKAALADSNYETLRLGKLGAHGYVTICALFRSITTVRRKAAERTLELVTPLLGRVIEIWQESSLLTRRAAAMAWALDGIDHGVIALGEHGEIAFANKTASEHLNSAEGLCRSRRSVTATSLVDAVRLQVAIDHVRLGRTDCRPGRRGVAPAPMVALTRPGKLRPLLVVIMPSDSETARGGVILHLFDPDRDVGAAVEVAAQVYGLSPVESRLARHLVEGHNLLEASTRLRIKEQTARGYLKQIFFKTETHRQADLVRLLLTSIARTRFGEQVELV